MSPGRLGDGRGLVGRAVVDDEDVDVRQFQVELVEHRGEIAFLVPGGDEDECVAHPPRVAAVLEGGVASFPHIHRDRVRFRDCDAMGHVNNAVFSTYLEESRIGVLGGLNAFILARVEIDFRSELRMGEEVEVATRCSRIGTKSFDLEHVISADGRVVAEARSVLVGYDYGAAQSVPLSDDLRRRLAA
jgi:acyl-CoA thioester hydrolase